jgi:hypothetical protein
MRHYKVLNWEYAVEAIQKIIGTSPKKTYILRYRLEYYLSIAGQNRFSKRLTSFLQDLLGFFSTIRYIFLYQVIKKPVSLKGDIIFFISDNPSFLRTTLPLVSEIISRKTPVAVFCPANHYRRLGKKIAPEIFASVQVIESLDTQRSVLSRLIAILAGSLKSVLDAIWFASRPIRHSATASAGLLRYSLSHYYYHPAWRKIFDDSRKKVLAANDYWFWESLLFTAAMSARAHSYVLQHGKLSDLYYPLFAKQFIAWSKADKTIMVGEYGARDEEIVVAGYPYFDETYNKAVEVNRRIPGFQRPYIAFLSQPYVTVMSHTAESYNTVTGWFYSLSGDAEIQKKYLLKLHPFDKEQNYPGRPGNIEISKEPLADVLEKISVVLTLDSTSMYEAALFNTITIQCLPPGETFFQDVSSTGMTLCVHSPEELKTILLTLSRDQEYFNSKANKALSALENTFANLGRSKEYIADLITS